MKHLEIYPHPAGAKPSPDYVIEVDGQRVWTGGFAAGVHAAFGLEGEAEVAIRPFKPLAKVPIVRPLRLGIVPELDAAGTLRFTLTRPAQLYLEMEGAPDLMLFANPIERDKPAPDDPNVRYFAAGRVHDVGPIRLESGQTLYIEGGALVKGHVIASGAERVRIAGPGILDGRHYQKGEHRLLVFDGCRDVQVEGLCTIGTPSWNLVFGACEDVRVSGVKLIGWVVSSDGIDIVGSKRVRVSDSFFRNNDDCVAIKALDLRGGNIQHNWGQDTQDVLVERCVMYNDRAGNVMEIGYETRAERISDITFRDIDVIGAHGEGGVFTIHNGDRARVENVRYEDIRVEHFYDKLIDFRIMPSRYSKDASRGHISGVHLKGIRTIEDRFNCVSLIGGFGPENVVRDVVIEDFQIGDRRILDADGLHLFLKHAEGVEFR